MREYWILTKLQLSSLYGINKIRHARDDDSRKKAKRSLTALVAMVLGLGWASTIYSMALAAAFASAGQQMLMLGLMAAAGMLVLVFSVFEAKGVLFGFGDYDTVMSWPVRTSAVVAARVTTMYVYNLIYALLLMLPAGVVYAVSAHPPIWFYFAYLVGILAAPALPTVLGAALGTLMTMLTARMQHKNLASSLGQIVLALGIMALSFSLNSGMERIAEKAASMGRSVTRVWPPAGWLMRAAEGNGWPLLLSVVVGALALTVFAWLLAGRFAVINARLTAVPHAAKPQRQKVLRASGAVRALYRMEWKRYIGSSLYLANTAFGYIMLLLLAVVLGIWRPPVLQEIFNDPSNPSMRAAIPLFVALIVTMSATTCASVSIEGKRLWIVKSLPVRARDWYLGKILVSLTLAVPSILVCGAIIGVGMRFTAWELVWMLLTPLSYALFFAVFGLAVNLRLPRFDWTAEAEIAKQSAAVMISVFAGMFLAGAPIALVLTGNAAVVLPVTTAAALLLAGLLFWRLARRGDETLYRL